ncbi:MAG: sulfur carrier protein ThiS [Clostridiales bacterium]|nr:sulfur carrier protein ThiS [Clostridiales bacterium]
MVKINGQMHDVAGKTVIEVLDQLNFNSNRVAVERNLEIIPRAHYADQTFRDGDEVEIVTFMGGG